PRIESDGARCPEIVLEEIALVRLPRIEGCFVHRLDQRQGLIVHKILEAAKRPGAFGIETGAGEHLSPPDVQTELQGVASHLVADLVLYLIKVVPPPLREIVVSSN